jgi:hypothetical protein
MSFSSAHLGESELRFRNLTEVIMSTGAIIGIIIAVIIVVAAIVVASGELRRARMRRQFGPEYERLAQKLGSKKKADAELAARQKRVQALNIHELSADQQASYSGDWTAVQERFVDTPTEAVSAASTLIWNVMRDRGYPVDNRDASMEALSFYHADSLDGYRLTQDIRPDTATTEELRAAMIRFRTLFEDLTNLRNNHGASERDRVAEIRERSVENSEVTTGDRELIEEDRGDLSAPDRTAETPR